MLELICEAIRKHQLLAFDYDGRHRIVAPYCHGNTRNGEVLRAIQVRGDSRSQGLGFGKLWLVEKIRNARKTAESFVPDDANYNPEDSAMSRIHCAVRRR